MGAAQCERPAAPREGFPIRPGLPETVTYSDGVATSGVLSHPDVAMPTCGWPLVVYVHSLGFERTQDAQWQAEMVRRGFAVWAYDVRGQGEARVLSPQAGTTLYGGAERFDLAEQISHVLTTHADVVRADRVAVLGDSQGGVHCWMAAMQSGRDLTVAGRGTIHFPQIACVAGADFVADPIDHRLRDEGLISSLFLDTLEPPPGVPLTVDAALASAVLDRFEQGDMAGLRSLFASDPGREFREALGSITVPVLFHHSWHDSICGAGPLLDAFDELPATTPARITLSTVGHGVVDNHYERALKWQLRLRWLDRFLWDEPNGVDREARMVLGYQPLAEQRLQDFEDLWPHAHEAGLPARGIEERVFWLGEESQLSADAPSAPLDDVVLQHRVGGGLDRTVWRREVQRRLLPGLFADVPLQIIDFETTLAESTELVGAPRVDLRVVPDAAEFSVAALLFARLPGGTDRMLCHWAAGRTTAVPGLEQHLTFELSPIAVRLPAGTVLRLEFRNLWIPESPHTRGLVTVPAFVDSDLAIRRGPANVGSCLHLPLRDQVATLQAEATELSTIAPGATRFELDAGVQRAGHSYIILSSISGHGPGLELPGGRLPLTQDPWFALFGDLLGSPEFPGFLGQLDADGRATAFMDLGALPALPADFLGARLSFAAWVHRSLGEIEGVPTQPVDLIAR